MNQAEYVAQAVANRSKMLDALSKAFTEAVEALVPQFKEDFKHQRFVRGISLDTSVEEVQAQIERWASGVADQVKNQVWDELANEGLLYGGL